MSANGLSVGALAFYVHSFSVNARQDFETWHGILQFDADTRTCTKPTAIRVRKCFSMTTKPLTPFPHTATMLKRNIHIAIQSLTEKL